MFKNNVTPLERLQLGSTLYEGLPHVEVTALVSDYQVSRWFLYDCKNLVKDILSTQFSPKKGSSTCESSLYLLKLLQYNFS
ncbi:MAG: hypothetical protein R3E32_28770 [Chitinophagales bacterium]